MPTVQELKSRLEELETRHEAVRREGESHKELCRELNHAQTSREALEIAVHALPSDPVMAQLYRCSVQSPQAEVVATWSSDGLLPVPVGQNRPVPQFRPQGQAGHILFFSDYAQVQGEYADLCTQWQRQGYRAGAFVFLIQGGTCVGGLHVQWEHPHEFSPAEQQRLDDIALLAPAVFASVWLREESSDTWNFDSVVQSPTSPQLTVPVIPMVDGLVVLPIIGDLDAAHTASLNEAIHTSIQQYRARFIIIDVTGVPLIDSTVIYNLVESIRSTDPHGVEVMVTGAGNETMALLDELGFPWDEIQMLHDLQSGLMIVLDHLGFTLKRQQWV